MLAHPSLPADNRRPVRAIETDYAGCRFRSRLEARWAVFFDHLAVDWEYEPEGFETPAGRYLPDFRIQIPQTKGHGHCQWFEVKPDGAPADPRHAELAAGLGQPLIVARGMPRDYMDQLRGLNQSPLMVYGVEQAAWPVAFCDSTSLHLPSAGGVGALYCSLGDNRHRCQEHMAWTMWNEGFCHLALHGLHEQDNYMTRPPLSAWNIDAAYTAARSARFEHGQAAVPAPRSGR